MAKSTPKTSTDRNLRQGIIATCLRLAAEGLTTGTSGNLSLRNDQGFLITPSGLPYEETKPADIVQLDAQGQLVGRNRRKPSSEWRIHRDILAQRPDVGAVLHCHSPYATAFAINRKAIPAHHYMIALVGGPTVPCARYATVATQALSDNALKALEGRKACLLANHGVIALGQDLDEAFRLASEVENLARLSILAQQIGKPKTLSNVEIERMIEVFKTYGKVED